MILLTRILHLFGHLKYGHELQKWKCYHDEIEKELTQRANGVYVLRYLLREFY